MERNPKVVLRAVVLVREKPLFKHLKRRRKHKRHKRILLHRIVVLDQRNGTMFQRRFLQDDTNAVLYPKRVERAVAPDQVEAIFGRCHLAQTREQLILVPLLRNDDRIVGHYVGRVNDN